MKKLFILLLFLFSTNCGYKPIYSNSNNDQQELQFAKIILQGDNKINKRIINILNLKENLNADKNLFLTANFKIEETSKNSKKEVTTYRSLINVNLLLKKEEKVIQKRNFYKEFSYNKKENKFDLIQYQNEIKKSLINDLSEEIYLFLKLS